MHHLQYSVAQMLIMGFEGTQIDSTHEIAHSIEKQGLGGVILFDKDLKKPGNKKNIESPLQVKNLTAQLQEFALHCTLSSPENSLPLFVAVDYEGGKVNRLKSDYGFPETLPAKIFATLSPKSAAIEANRMCRTLTQSGFNLNFAPLIDVDIYPENPIIGKLYRSFSSDPGIVADYAAIVAKAHHDANIRFCYKHFPGHGSSRGDSHLGIVDVTETWQPQELFPYQQLLKKSFGCDMIMSAHIINRQLDPSGLPASLSPKILTELLREQWDYSGLLIADDLQMNAITDAFGLEESLVMAINAGNDLLIIGNQCGSIDYSTEEIVDLIVKNVIDQKIPRSRIDESFQRIQQAKKRFREHRGK